MHMAFTGSPGTGKTEVARLVGRILREEGILSVGDFLECGRQELVGQFVGQTAPKVAALFQRARGSVIFVDEAYSLLDDRRGGFGDEAINAMVAQMEALRDDVVVILAGYPDEIEALLRSNPGLSSRVATRVAFPDYDADDLVAILRLMVSMRGLTLADGCEGRARDILSRASSNDDFGNARFVRNLVERAVTEQGTRLCAACGGNLSGLGTCALATLVPEDFVWDGPTSRPPMGFVA